MTPALLLSLDRVERALYSGVFNCLSFRLLGFLKLNVDVRESGGQVGTEVCSVLSAAGGCSLALGSARPTALLAQGSSLTFRNSSHEPQGFLIFQFQQCASPQPTAFVSILNLLPTLVGPTFQACFILPLLALPLSHSFHPQLLPLQVQQIQ